ncbi:MAG: MBL fold metallo-hydrolase [Pseudomonadota bacterium]
MTNHLSRRGALAAGAGTAAVSLLGGGGPAIAASPMLGAARPTYYRFVLGGFEVTTLLDGAIQLDGPHPIFGQDQTAEAVEALAEANHLPATRMEIGFTPVLVNTGNELVLFDSGNGPGRRPSAANLVQTLAAAGYTPEQVDVVVLTHFHGDHVGGLIEDGSVVYPNARLVTHAREFDFWTAEERLSGPTENTARLVQANVVPLAERMTFIDDGQDAASGITMVAAHGHTPGHAAYHIESEGRRLLLWADAANHYVMSVQRPDWHVRFDMDKEMAAATRRQLLDMAAAERIPATGYHMPFPAVGFVEADGAGYRWVQASYQLNL